MFNKSEVELEQEFNYINEKSYKLHKNKNIKYAMREDNYLKNRYRDILPYDEYRVKLSMNEESDYINASHISDEYISCQAPLPHTIQDFWRMIWENNVGVIVMLTNLVEKEKVKCHQYWPQKKQTIYRISEKFCIQNIKSNEFDGTTIRVLRIYYIDEVTQTIKATRDIYHLHFVKWSDMGVPETTKPIRNLCSLTNICKEMCVSKNITGKIVVHCAAGCGRAGTFITIQMLLDQLFNNNNNDSNDIENENPQNKIQHDNNIEDKFNLDSNLIPDTVLQIRECRVGMVQTKEQYSFIYKTVLDAIEDHVQKQDIDQQDSQEQPPQQQQQS